jgi:ABC-2 type transport system permease protein
MRIASTPPPPPLEIAASLVVRGLSAWLAMRLAARVFRVGVLMYGKPPSLRELWRWVRVRG